MVELLLRKPVEEGIPPAPLSGLKMTVTHKHSAKIHYCKRKNANTAQQYASAVHS